MGLAWAAAASLAILVAGCMSPGPPSQAADGECGPVSRDGLEPNLEFLPQFAQQGPEQAARLRLAIEGIPMDAPWKRVTGSSYVSGTGTYELGGTDWRRTEHFVTFWTNEAWPEQRVLAVAQAILDTWGVDPADWPQGGIQFSDANWTWFEGVQPGPYWAKVEVNVQRPPEGLPVAQVLVDALYDVESDWPVSAEGARSIGVPMAMCMLVANGLPSEGTTPSGPEWRRVEGRAAYSFSLTLVDEAPCGSASVAVDAETGRILEAAFTRGTAFPVGPCERAGYASLGP